MIKYAMISQPMQNKTKEQIIEERSKVTSQLNNMGYVVLDTVFEYISQEAQEANVLSAPLFYLGKALEAMSLCDLVVFMPEWEDARGCRVELRAALEYEIQIAEYVEENIVWIS